MVTPDLIISEIGFLRLVDEVSVGESPWVHCLDFGRLLQSLISPSWSQTRYQLTDGAWELSVWPLELKRIKCQEKIPFSGKKSFGTRWSPRILEDPCSSPPAPISAYTGLSWRVLENLNFSLETHVSLNVLLVFSCILAIPKVVTLDGFVFFFSAG